MSDQNESNDLIVKARKSIEDGRWDDGLSYFRMAKQRITSKMESLKNKVKNVRSSQGAEIAELADQLERLKFQKDIIEREIETCSREKERAETFRNLVESITEADVMARIREQQSALDKALARPRTLLKDESYFLCLRKWNSYTPFVSGDMEECGGGYFVVWKGSGIVVDPGIKFAHHFLRAGYSICDIDAIVLTHSHVDHTADFECIMTLLYEINSLRKTSGIETHKVKIYSNVGAANKFMNLIAQSYDSIGNLVIMNAKEKFKIVPDLTMTACSAFHNDLFAPNVGCSLGLIFSSDDGRLCFGITSDTGYRKELKDEYISLKGGLMVLHIGSIKNEELDVSRPREGKYQEHLGIRGVYNLIYDVKPKLAILSEFGEELRDVRQALSASLHSFLDKTAIIPGDMFLKVDLSKNGLPFRFQCSKCKEFKDVSSLTLDCAVTSKDIVYLCDECMLHATD
jgi:hypothetical protein